MASLALSGDTSGSITISAPAVSGSNTQTLVATTGTLAPVVSGTAVASTSGTSIDFTSIPSWVKRITVMLAGVSLSGADSIQVQLGSGSFTTSGYSGGGARLGAASVAAATFTTGFALNNATAASLISGNITITNVTGNTWSATGLCGETSGEFICMVGGFIALSGTLDRLRVTTNGSNTFDAGTINILYE